MNIKENLIYSKPTFSSLPYIFFLAAMKLQLQYNFLL